VDGFEQMPGPAGDEEVRRFPVDFDLGPGRQAAKGQRDLFVSRIDRASDRPQFPGEHASRALGQFLSVLDGQIESAAGDRVLVAAAAGDEHRLGTRETRLDLDLGEPGVVAAKLVSIEDRAMAGVAENDGIERSVRPVDF